MATFLKPALRLMVVNIFLYSSHFTKEKDNRYIEEKRIVTNSFHHSNFY